MNIFITGVNGFIGSHLARYLKEKGNEVYGCSIEATARENLLAVLSGYSTLFLNRDFDPGIFKNIDCLIHCAYSYEKKNITTTNIEGAKKLYHAGKDRGVKKQIFLTSYSAKPGSQSEYGFIKYELENFFLQEKQVIIRPGLVLGNGGMFQGMRRLLKTYPVIPLLDGGAYDVPIISVAALCRTIEKVIAVTGPAQYHIFQEEPVSMKHLLLAMKRQLGARCLLVPVPSFLPRLFLKMLETWRIPFPIKSSSIVALKENRQLSYRSHLKQLGIVDSPLEEILRSIKD